MRHINLTCKNHPDKRWNCKSIAISPHTRGYNGARNIFFNGPGLECSCPGKDLVIAPDDPWVNLSEEELRQAIAKD